MLRLLSPNISFALVAVRLGAGAVMDLPIRGGCHLVCLLDWNHLVVLRRYWINWLYCILYLHNCEQPRAFAVDQPCAERCKYRQDSAPGRD